MEGNTKIPKLLREIPDPPKKLYLVGSLPDEEKYIFLTIVGSRKYTRYGEEALRYILSGISNYPFVIVSGLAYGIDSIAHRLAMEFNLKTIAIPGSGLNEEVIYPSGNKKLAKEILKNGGALLSEFEPSQRAQTWTFPKRNRIMAGISHATIVIEAEEKSGTRITARLATEYNRDVFAVPGSIFSPSSQGCNSLIKEGAYPLSSAEDILKHFSFEKKEKEEKESIPLSKEEEKILQVLSSPKGRNELSRELKVPIHILNIHLSSLEIKGLIFESMGKIQRKKN